MPELELGNQKLEAQEVKHKQLRDSSQEGREKEGIGSKYLSEP